MAGEVSRRVEGPGPMTFEGARILFRNFAGREGQYNREGDRNFALVVDNDIAETMKAEGWNIKYLKPREVEDAPQAYLQIAVSYKNRPPRTVMITRNGRTNIPEDLVEFFDVVEIGNVDLIITPYPWAVNGNTGIKAYLKAIYVTVAEDELEVKYAEVPDITPGQPGMLQGQIAQLSIEAGEGQDPNEIEGEIVEDDDSDESYS